MKPSRLKAPAKIEGTAAPLPLPLVPPFLLVFLWSVALTLPNLVYSGTWFADTLHIIKWVVAGIPVAVALFVAGCRLLRHGGKRLELRVDLFGALWFLMLLYCAVQPLWVDVSSTMTWMHELVCLAAVWAFYVLSADSFPNGALRPILWLANVNAAINVLFAELQIRNLNDLAFLEETPLSFLRPLSSLILPTPGNYIGNTAQQNMFGLWMAICVMSSAYLFVAYATGEGGRKRPLWMTVLNLILMGINTWGLWTSTSRSGIFALFVGLFVLGVTLLRFGRAFVLRFGVVLLLFLVVLGGSFLASRERSTELLRKTGDMVENAWTVGGRVGIWTTSAAMFKEHPMGVGLGQYKWHYLEAQREAFKTNREPWYTWQYTHWAHNEFLQWFCEAGVIGGAMLLLMFGLWFVAALWGLFGRRAEGAPPLPPAALWACALVALIAFNALWTRPFHRIENTLWLALAFAIANREFLTGRLGWRMGFTQGFNRLLGILFMILAAGGAVYLGSGVEGNILVRQALSTRNASLQRHYLEQAQRHPIVREEALRNLGYHYLQVGDQTNDIAAMNEGFNLLWQHFLREPHSEDMSSLLNWAQRFQLEEAIQELASYLKPGTYRLQRQAPTRDSRGNLIRPLVLIPIHNSGGMQFDTISGERQSMDPAMGP